MAEELELIGDDSQIFTGALSGTELTGDNTKTLDELAGGTAGSGAGKGMYIITEFASGTTFWPEGMEVGELFPAVGTEILKTGDKCKKLDLSQIADASGWSLQITRTEVDVTRLKDSFKKYRYGKKDASGTLNSIFTIGVTDKATGLVGQTMKLFKKIGNTITVTIPNDQNLYFLGYVRKTETGGETEDFVFGQITMSNITLGGQSGSAQSYDSSFRLTGVDPVFYSIDIPLT